MATYVPRALMCPRVSSLCLFLVKAFNGNGLVTSYDPGCVKTPEAQKRGEIDFSDQSRLVALRNCLCFKCDPKRDLFYQFRRGRVFTHPRPKPDIDDSSLDHPCGRARAHAGTSQNHKNALLSATGLTAKTVRQVNTFGDGVMT